MLPALDLTGLKAGDGLPAINLENYLGLWAIEESAATAMWQMVTSMDLTTHVRTSEVRQSPPDAVMTDENIAIIQIRGTMTKAGSSLSSAGSMVKLRQQVRAAANDTKIDGIMTIIDSPGGTVAGTAELGSEIAAASLKKPVVTLAEDLMASAALWVGSQANLVFANSDHATVGSKGVFVGLYDYSGAAAKEGIRPVVIRTGDLKGAGFPGLEISDAHKAMWQGMVDAANASFDSAMSKRRMGPDAMQELSRGGVFTGKAATSMGLIDGIRSADGALSELRSLIQQKGSKRRRATMTDQSPAANLAELEAACRGADEKFLLAQMRQGATVATASSNWMSALHARNAELSAELARLGPFEASAKELTGKLSEAEAGLASEKAKVVELTGQLATANAAVAVAKKNSPYQKMNDLPKQGKAAGGDPAGSLDEDETSATDQWEAAIAAEMTRTKKNRASATVAVVAKNPELHQAYLAEFNANRPVSQKR